MPPKSAYQIDYAAKVTNRSDDHSVGFYLDFGKSGQYEQALTVVTKGAHTGPAFGSGLPSSAPKRDSLYFDRYVEQVARYVLTVATKDSVAAGEAVTPLLDQWAAQGISNSFVDAGTVRFTQGDVIAFVDSVDSETPEAVREKWGRSYVTERRARNDSYRDVWMYVEDYRRPRERETLHVAYSTYPLTGAVMAEEIFSDVSPQSRQSPDRKAIEAQISQALVAKGGRSLYLPDGSISAPAAVRVATGLTPPLERIPSVQDLG